jgi:hypothetical protein
VNVYVQGITFAEKKAPDSVEPEVDPAVFVDQV